MDLKEFLKDADMVLVGIGEAFQEKFECVEVEEKKKGTIF